jgi:orotate phosphoribosyltransferase
MGEKVPKKLKSLNELDSSFLFESLRLHTHFGEFDLASGGTSTFYVDAKPLLLDSFTLRHIAVKMLGKIKSAHSTIAGVGISGALLIPALLAISARPLKGLIIRKEPKTHGTCRVIEGDEAIRGVKVVLIDDVLTRGTNLGFAARALKDLRDCTIVQWVVLVDRTTSLISGAPPISAICKASDFIEEN